MRRSSGILMSISSLPSEYGIGTLGRAAYDFADFLKAAGQRVWQMLPLGPTGYGDSPYSSVSAYAGNPYYIDLAALCEEGLLDKKELDALDWGSEDRLVDYGKIYSLRLNVLEKAFAAGAEKYSGEIEEFKKKNAAWLPDYALFMALKRHFGMKPWTEWPDEDAAFRRPEALLRYREALRYEVDLFVFIQYEFYRQWDALRSYVHSLGIEIAGDVPIYAALDSADVWAEPQFFLLDDKNMPTEVSGVPPDGFCDDGQLWGNPIYNWERMAEDGYGWWLRRIGGARRLYDIIRIDHFRGLESYWSIPSGADTAAVGKWRPGPGMSLVNTIKNWFPGIKIIAEDLGWQTKELKKLLSDSGFPGMKVLEFAFGTSEPSEYLPHLYDSNCVCYTGTHDNETLAQWLSDSDPDSLRFAEKYFGLNDAEGRIWGVIRGGMSSAAGLFVCQMQDCLGLGAEARMNRPGTAVGNWRWRLRKGEASVELAARLREYAAMYGRI